MAIFHEHILFSQTSKKSVSEQVGQFQISSAFPDLVRFWTHSKRIWDESSLDLVYGLYLGTIQILRN